MSDVFATEEYAVKGDGGNASPVPVAGGHTYDLEMNPELDEVTLTEDGSDKTTLPLVAEYVGTRADYENLSAEEQAKYRIMHFKGDGGFGDISDNQVAFTSEDCSDANATTWTSVTPLETGLSLRTLFNRVSQMFKNVRYLNSALNALTKNSYGTAVDLTQYTASNLYTFPSDGYIRAYGGYGSSTNAKAILYGSNGSDAMSTTAIGDFTNSLFVKKGMRGYGTKSDPSCSVIYRPLQ